MFFAILKQLGALLVYDLFALANRERLGFFAAGERIGSRECALQIAVVPLFDDHAGQPPLVPFPDRRGLNCPAFIGDRFSALRCCGFCASSGQGADDA